MTVSKKFAPNNVTLQFLSKNELDVAKLKARRALSMMFTLEKIVGLELIALQATVKSQVFLAKLDTHNYVIKLHSYADNFARELLAYFLFDGSPIPMLVNYNIEHKSLILNYVNGREFKLMKDDVIAIATMIGKCHGAAQRNLQRSKNLQRLIDDNSRLVRRGDSNSRLTRLDKYKIIEYLYAKIFGNDHTRVCIGDVKPEHCLFNENAWVILDIETVTTGMYEIHDILSLVNFTSSYQEFKNILPKIIKEYVRAYSEKFRAINSYQLTILVDEYEKLVGLKDKYHTSVSK